MCAKMTNSTPTVLEELWGIFGVIFSVRQAYGTPAPTAWLESLVSIIREIERS